MNRQARVNETIPEVSWSTATFVKANSDGTALVDFGDGQITVLATFLPRFRGSAVRVLRVDNLTVLVGLAVPFPAEGVVATVGATTATVTTDAGTLTLPWVGSAPTVADTVAIESHGVIIGKVSLPASTTYASPGAPGTGGTFTLDFRAADSGSYFGSSWWTNTVRCSDGNIGAWFYGTTIADTIPDSATIVSVQVKVKETVNQFPGSLATIGLHGLLSKAGVPVVTSAVTIPAGSGFQALPTSFGDALKTGASYGLGTAEGGYHVYAGRATDADSGLLRITYAA